MGAGSFCLGRSEKQTPLEMELALVWSLNFNGKTRDLPGEALKKFTKNKFSEVKGAFFSILDFWEKCSTLQGDPLT